MSARKKKESDLRSFVIGLTAKDWDPGVAPLSNRLPHRLLEEFSIDGKEPGHVHSVGRKQGRGGIDSITKGGVWSDTEAFQSVRS